MSDKEKEITKFLRHIGEDIVPDGIVPHSECEGQGIDAESCAEHGVVEFVDLSI